MAADLCKSAVAETAAACVMKCAEVEAVTVDVVDAASVEAMMAAAVARFGRVDCAVNAAGIEGERANLHETAIANFDKVLGVNLKGIFLCMRAEIKQMLAQTAAVSSTSAAAAIDVYNFAIVNLGSSAGLAGMPEFSCYSASKFAILGLTKSAAREYAAHGIRVNAVCPSTTDTPMVARFAERWPEWQAKQNASFPVGRIGRAEEVAAACAFLLSAACPMITGTSITIDGGLSS